MLITVLFETVTASSGLDNCPLLSPLAAGLLRNSRPEWPRAQWAPFGSGVPICPQSALWVGQEAEGRRGGLRTIHPAIPWKMMPAWLVLGLGGISLQVLPFCEPSGASWGCTGEWGTCQVSLPLLSAPSGWKRTVGDVGAGHFPKACPVPQALEACLSDCYPLGFLRSQTRLAPQSILPGLCRAERGTAAAPPSLLAHSASGK